MRPDLEDSWFKIADLLWSNDDPQRPHLRATAKD